MIRSQARSSPLPFARGLIVGEHAGEHSPQPADLLAASLCAGGGYCGHDLRADTRQVWPLKRPVCDVQAQQLSVAIDRGARRLAWRPCLVAMPGQLGGQLARLVELLVEVPLDLCEPAQLRVRCTLLASVAFDQRLTGGPSSGVITAGGNQRSSAKASESSSR